MIVSHKVFTCSAQTFAMLPSKAVAAALSRGAKAYTLNRPRKTWMSPWPGENASSKDCRPLTGRVPLELPKLDADVAHELSRMSIQLLLRNLQLQPVLIQRCLPEHRDLREAHQHLVERADEHYHMLEARAMHICGEVQELPHVGIVQHCPPFHPLHRGHVLQGDVAAHALPEQYVQEVQEELDMCCATFFTASAAPTCISSCIVASELCAKSLCNLANSWPITSSMAVLVGMVEFIKTLLFNKNSVSPLASFTAGNRSERSRHRAESGTCVANFKRFSNHQFSVNTAAA